MFFSLKKTDPTTELEKLYSKYGPHILNYLTYHFAFPTQIAEELTQDTFSKIMPHIDMISSLEHEHQKRAYIITTAKRLALNEIQNSKTLVSYTESDDGNGDNDQTSSENYLINKRFIEIASSMEDILCLQLCMEKALAKYKKDYPDALCPLLVTLSNLQPPIRITIEDLAGIISETVPKTQRLLKQCRRKMNRYNNYAEYQNQHGLESMCWLIIQLRAMGFKLNQIGEIIGKTEGAIRQDVSRCLTKGLPHNERYCITNCK